jgi:hypothetical protein
MRQLLILALIGGGLRAQNPSDLFNKPPADVDQALRARISEFYQYHVAGQFRQAEAMVAEDTKDYFYSHKKPRYLSFEIVRIEYSENFTRANATMSTEQHVPIVGLADKPLKIPSRSMWKLENGKWCWFVDQDALRNTPFGRMVPGPGKSTGGMPPPVPEGGGLPSLPSPGGLPGMPPTKSGLDTSPAIKDVLNRIKADKQTVGLKSGAPDQVKFTNTALGRMDLKVVAVPEGIEAKFDRAALNPNDVAVLTVRAGKDAKSGAIRVQVEQTSEFIAIQADVK